MEAARAFTNDSVGIDPFCELIKFNKIRAHALIDTTYQEERPTFDIFIKSKANADEFMQDYGGLYYLYRIEQNSKVAELLNVPPSKKIISRGTVSIRYPIQYTKISNAYHIRCKVCVPAYGFKHDSLKIHRLDGLVSDYQPISKLLYWTLEHRAPPANEKYSDLMNIQTECKFETDRQTGLKFVRGAMSTGSQNDGDLQKIRGRDILVSSIVLIRYRNTYTEKISYMKDVYGGEYNDFWFLMRKTRTDGISKELQARFDTIPKDRRIIYEGPFMMKRTGLFRPEAAGTPSDKLAVRLLQTPWERLQVLTALE